LNLMADEQGRIRWSPSEWQRVAAYAVPHIDKGVPINRAIEKAQRSALPPARRRDEDAIRRIVWQAPTRRFIEEARALSPEKRAEIAPPPPPRKAPSTRPKLDEGRDYSGAGRIRWTTLEKARIARQVNQWKAAGDTRAVSRLIIEAQELVIERDRRRSIVSIQSCSAPGGLNEQMLAEGTANEWLLTDPQAAAAIQAPATTAAPATTTTNTAAPATTAAPAEPSPIAAPQGAEAAHAPTPLPHTPNALSDAARAFGEVVMGALDNLLAVHTETLMREVYARMSAAMSAQAEATSRQIAEQTAAMVERGMRETVHRIVEVELGGPVASPPPVTADAPAQQQAAAVPVQVPTPEPEPPRAKVIKVDVVGLNNGSMEQEVRKALNGHADLRFVNPDTGNGYAPHRGRHCIMITQRVPHALKHKIKAAGVEPIYVKSTTGHVIQAIEELHRAIDMTGGNG
jgi:hypothetical protein